MITMILDNEFTHNTPRETIHYTDSELEILHSHKVEEFVKQDLYQSKLSDKKENSKEVVLTRVIKLSVKNCGQITNVKGEVEDCSIITWVSTYSHGQVEKCSGTLEIDSDLDMFIWE